MTCQCRTSRHMEGVQDENHSKEQVVANTVAALADISESHPNSTLLDLNPQNINKLLTALNECTKWGQVFILDCLSNYNPKDDREAQR
ncbi:AP-2 complex subunit beta [Manis javanica]|nr:AP-2 complex subunit beta [Manis javanica]